jgi:hypothetical protein
MRVVVYAEDVDISDEDIDKSDIILDIDEDQKGFTIKRHTNLAPNFRLYPSCRYPKRHMSELKHIILSGGLKNV